MRKKTLLVTTLAAVMAVNMAGCGLLGGNGQNSPVNMNYDVNVNVNGQDVVNASNNNGGNGGNSNAGGSNAAAPSSQAQVWATATQTAAGYEYNLQGTGVTDDFELGNGLTFGEVADYFEFAVDRFDKENFRKTFSLINISSNEYKGKVKTMLNMSNANVCPDQLYCMQAAFAWELSNHFGNIEKIEYVEEEGHTYMIMYNDHSVLEADLVYDTMGDSFYMIPAGEDLSKKVNYTSAGLNTDSYSLFLTTACLCIEEKLGSIPDDLNTLYPDDWK